MHARPHYLRNFTFLSVLAVGLTMGSASSQAYTEEDQKRLCMGDAFRLCSSEIPDRARVIACMHRQRAHLSAGCRSVFGKSTSRSASARPAADD